MRVVCAPAPKAPSNGIAYSLFTAPQDEGVGRVAVEFPSAVRRAGVEPSRRAWDFLAFALGAVAADYGCPRKRSPDGWTREIELEVAVTEPDFWATQAGPLENALRFLTCDRWRVRFSPGGLGPLGLTSRSRRVISGDSTCLLSGGVDSLAGAIDAVAAGMQPAFVTQVAQGDGPRQRRLAAAIGPSLSHLQLSHAVAPSVENSQRARSIVFLAFGVLAASALQIHRDGSTVDLLVPENGFISLNVPLTPLRVGSWSTRTTHPFFLQQIQGVLDSSDLRTRIVTPYQFKTKGELLRDCADTELLHKLVFDTTSCGRFARFNYKHCGRCVPCLVRRAAFHCWGVPDQTEYKFRDLSIPDKKHRDFDDVRSVAMALLKTELEGLDNWIGSAVSSAQLGDTTEFTQVVDRGLRELGAFLRTAGAL